MPMGLGQRFRVYASIEGTMLSQEKLLKALDTDIRICRNAKYTPNDEHGKKRQILESATLIRHLQWAQSAGNDQTILEQIVQSLEKNAVVGYQHWRNLATIWVNR
jgi:hypothetical protein